MLFLPYNQDGKIRVKRMTIPYFNAFVIRKEMIGLSYCIVSVVS